MSPMDASHSPMGQEWCQIPPAMSWRGDPWGKPGGGRELFVSEEKADPYSSPQLQSSLAHHPAPAAPVHPMQIPRRKGEIPAGCFLRRHPEGGQSSAPIKPGQVHFIHSRGSTAGSCTSEPLRKGILQLIPAGNCAMPKALRDVEAALTCLQLLLLVTGVELRPHTWDGDRLQLEAIKKGILARLGMPAPPVIRQRLDQESIRRAQQLYQHTVDELMQNRSREEEEGAVPRTRRLHRLTPTLLHRDPPGHGDAAGPHRYHLLLSRTEAFQRQLRVVQAELKLFKPGSLGLNPLRSSVPPRVSIYSVGGAQGTPQLLQSQELDRDAPSVDLTAAVRPWAAGAEDSLRLELLFSTDVSALLPPSSSSSEALVLEVETHESGGRGARRARGLEEECGKSDGKCCLKSLKVSFQDIGWSDWIIAPNSYYMRFCEGSCPHNYKPASMHAQIKARMHSLSKATPPPCCVPAGYDPMVLMHYNSEGRLVSTLFEDMLVTKCHCA
ncbi:growth/differentiation factor 15 [Neopsephotus bourkii]|uniref:growth/differentiation factor 15 n=1 Tax=Neopsephotus bourkii TaxID=309878 RepID=UPI002AA5A8A0|nr:growth/differentiation factor 15 [Neopsephotus bourkii]